MCCEFVECNFGYGVEKGKYMEFKDDNSIYCFFEDDELIVLNFGMSFVCELCLVFEVVEELWCLIFILYSKYLFKDGKVI